ncbi:MAG: TRAP transporter substrate-binding protein [Pseudomonadota bacterium]
MAQLSRILAALLIVVAPVRATAAEVTLLFHTFLGPNSATVAQLVKPWADRMAAASEGRIAVEIFPSMALGGKPPELYRQVRDGVADIVWTLPGYTPGVFPRSEVFELPSVHGGSAMATTMAIQSAFDMIAEDFQEIHPLLVHVHAGNALHLRKAQEVSAPALSGLKLRTPSRTGAWMIEAWGAEPVGMPVPALPQALAKGAVDGALVPFEILPLLKLDELTELSVEGPNERRFGTAIFLLAMNKDRYQALPDDLRAILDAETATLAEEAGRIWTGVEPPGKAGQAASGGEVRALSPDAMAEFDRLAETVEARWIAEADAAGLDGAALIDAAKAAMAAAPGN